MFVQTWLAYSFEGRTDLDLNGAVSRVESAVNGCSPEVAQLVRHTGERTGHMLWTRKDDASRLGLYEVPDVTGESRFDLYPVQSEAAWPDPWSHPFPWLRSVFDGRNLEIRNDPLGFARLYSLELDDEVRLWSNRMSALAAFAGVVPASSQEGWACYATIGWFLGDLLPFDGMSIAPGGTVIRSSGTGGTVTTRDVTVQDLLARRSAPADSDVAGAIGATVEHRLRLHPGRLVFGLSGGRDSRLLAAAMLRSPEWDRVDFFTSVPPQVEAEVVRGLMELLPERPSWEVRDRVVGDWTSGAGDRPRGWRRWLHRHTAGESPFAVKTRRWHEIFDGDIYPTFIYREAPATCLSPFTGFGITGAAGEFAHANFYTATHVAEPASKRVAAVRKAFFERAPYTTAEAREVGAAEFDRIIKEAGELGLSEDLRQLDYYYVVGRFRRWANGNVDTQNALPLADPAFLSAGFWQTVNEKLDSSLHRRVTAHLLPAWEGHPYMAELVKGRPLRERTNVGARRYLWESEQFEDFRELLENVDHYDEGWDTDEIRQVFAQVQGVPADHHVRLQNVAFRVAWREGFERYRRDLEERIRCADVESGPRGRTVAEVS